MAYYFHDPLIWKWHTQTSLVTLNTGVVDTSVELATSCGLVNVGFGFGFKVDGGEGIILVIFSDRVDTRFGMEDFALGEDIVVDFVVVMGIFPIVEADPRINIHHD